MASQYVASGLFLFAVGASMQSLVVVVRHNEHRHADIPRLADDAATPQETAAAARGRGRRLRRGGGGRR